MVCCIGALFLVDIDFGLPAFIPTPWNRHNLLRHPWISLHHTPVHYRYAFCFKTKSVVIRRTDVPLEREKKLDHHRTLRFLYVVALNGVGEIFLLYFSLLLVGLHISYRLF